MGAPISLLQGISSTTAIMLIMGLVIGEEAGIPMPFAPGEVVYMTAGILIASGEVPFYVVLPLIVVAATVGMMTGYLWARAVGRRGLESLAQHMHAGAALDKVEQRLQTAGSLGVFVTRLFPGLRIYTTLVSGAIDMPLPTFLTGAVPASAIWILFFTVVGMLVGIPAVHILTGVEKIGTRVFILLFLLLFAWLTVRRMPPGVRRTTAIARGPIVWRLLVAGLIDLTLIVVTEELVGYLMHLGLGSGLHLGWVIDTAGGLLALCWYVALSRWRAGATIGELLLNTSYRSSRRAQLHTQDVLAHSAAVMPPIPGPLEQHTLADESHPAVHHHPKARKASHEGARTDTHHEPPPHTPPPTP